MCRTTTHTLTHTHTHTNTHTYRQYFGLSVLSNAHRSDSCRTRTSASDDTPYVSSASDAAASLLLFSYSPGYTLGQVDGRMEEVGHADTRKTMADSRSEN